MINREKTVLVAEENRKICRLLAFIFRRKGYRVIHTYNGRAALKALTKETIDAAILDTMLPYLDGIQVLRQLRLLNPYLPVIMLSVKIRETDRQVSLNLGANDYITRPFELDNLVRRLMNVLGDN